MSSEQFNLATKIANLIATYKSTATVSNLVSNECSNEIFYIEDRDDGRYRIRASVGSAPDSSITFEVISEVSIPIANSYQATDKSYQVTRSGVELFKSTDGKLTQLLEDGTLKTVSDRPIDHFSLIDPTDSIVAVIDERLLFRIELDGSETPLFDERSTIGPDYFIADPVAQLDADLVVFRFWEDWTMPFYESSLRAISLTNKVEVPLDLVHSPIYSQPQFGCGGRFFSYIAVVEDHLKIVVQSDGERFVVSHDPMDQGDYDYGFGQRTYCFNEGEKSLYFQNYKDGLSTLFRYDLHKREATQLEFGHFNLLTPISMGVVTIRSGAKTPTNITAIRIKKEGDSAPTHQKKTLFSCYPSVDRGALKEPESFFCATVDEEGNSIVVNGHLYRASGEERGLIILIHGGPVSSAKVTWQPKIPLLNQLGFSVVTFNPRGSSGYGHSFMLALKGRYGVSDVDDTLSVIDRVSEITGAKVPIFISGGSAAGVVAVGAVAKLLARVPQELGEGAPRSNRVRGLILSYPVLDIIYVNSNTHRFEKNYFNHLIGPYPTAHDEYVRRSPLSLDIDIPTLIIQGDDDKVVPIESVLEYVRKRRNATIEVMEGYGHGFSDPKGQRREIFLLASYIQAIMG